jgi:uncharacterized membrane protein
MTTPVSNQFTTLRKYFLKNESETLLIASVAFSCFLVLLRILVTGQITFIFLVWNLFLATIPYIISRYCWLYFHLLKNRMMVAVLFIAWLLFIPNSFYILTDLFHLGNTGNAPLWYDLLVILSFAWNGLILGLLSVRHMEKVFQCRFGTSHELLFLYPVMWLNAFGVYIGRYLRFNSWDIITSPFRLFVDVIDILIHPMDNKNALAMVITWSVFMTLIYLSIRKISRLL